MLTPGNMRWVGEQPIGCVLVGEVLSSGEFCVAFSAEFDRSSPPNLDDLLVDDLGFDSLDMFNLVAFIEETANSSESDGAGLPILTSVRDAYEYLQELAVRSND
jgi:acyl carrier protein